MSPLLASILDLKKTADATGKPMGYREIGQRLKLSPMGVKYHTRELKGRCPCCLRKLEKESKP